MFIILAGRISPDFEFALGFKGRLIRKLIDALGFVYNIDFPIGIGVFPC